MEERICSQCGEIIEDDDFEIVDGQVLCSDCVDEHCTTCDRCGYTIWTDNSYGDECITLCEDCYNRYYRRCESCNSLVHEDDIYWHNDLPYCHSCYDDIEEEDQVIKDYSYKPDPIFYGKGERFFGVELEVDCGGKDDDNAQTLLDYSSNHIYIKSDGSLDDGFEIVSHPMTLDYHMNEMNWEAILHEAVKMGYRSHQTSTCGLHIHVNRNAFGDNQAEQEEVISKILFFVEKHWAEMFRFSRRSDYNMNRWSARYGFEKTGKEILEKAKDSTNGRYVAVNLRNYHTIEFRLFRGTLKYNTFIAALQLVDEICNTALFSFEEELEKLSWSEFVRRIKAPELIQYLKERQLYINDKIDSEEEI